MKKEKIVKQPSKSKLLPFIIGLIIVIILAGGYFVLTKYFINKPSTPRKITTGKKSEKQRNIPPKKAKEIIEPRMLYAVVVTSDSSEENANADMEKLKKEGYNPEIMEINLKGNKYYRVIAQTFDNRTDAETLKNKINSEGKWDGVFISAMEANK